MFLHQQAPHPPTAHRQQRRPLEHPQWLSKRTHLGQTTLDDGFHNYIADSFLHRQLSQTGSMHPYLMSSDEVQMANSTSSTKSAWVDSWSTSCPSSTTTSLHQLGATLKKLPRWSTIRRSTTLPQRHQQLSIYRQQPRMSTRRQHSSAIRHPQVRNRLYYKFNETKAVYNKVTPRQPQQQWRANVLAIPGIRTHPRLYQQWRCVR